MNKEEDVPVAEEVVNEVEDTQSSPEEQAPEESRQVPLQALEAERRKRQDLEAENRALQHYLKSKDVKETPEEDSEDEEEFITKAELKKRIADVTFKNKREVLEEAYVDANPDKINLVNTHLESIIKRKPWLAQTLESAPNRYARAYEIVEDYMPKEAPNVRTNTKQSDAKRIVENSQKPGNPSVIAKASSASQSDYLKSIRGKPEFREYRQKMLAGG